MISTQVLVVGSGPVGLLAALELRRAGVSDVLVADRRTAIDARHRLSKALTVNAGTIETFRTLHLDDRFVGSGITHPATHFGANPTLLKLTPDLLGTKHPYNLIIPQQRTEHLLFDECEKQGVKFVWGVDLIGLEQHPDRVTARFGKLHAGDEAPEELIEAPWLVGCDGAHSTVRKAAGITTEGSDPSISGWLFEGQAAPGTGNFELAFGPDGMCMYLACGDGFHRFMGAAHPVPGKEGSRDLGLSEQEARKQVVRAFGTDFGVHSCRWFTLINNRVQLASTFRTGRVFIAGDAAHSFYPAGGQGMNTGLQDAANLAWKLGVVATGTITDAAVIERVLDSYSDERKMAAQAIIENVQVQTQLLATTDAKDMAVRNFVAEVLKNEDLNQLWALRVAGFGDPIEAYKKPLETSEDEPLRGTRVTHIGMDHIDRLIRGTENGYCLALLVLASAATDTGLKHELKGTASQWGHEVCIIDEAAPASHEKWRGVQAVLVRPDLRIAWVGREGQDRPWMKDRLDRCLRWWMGPP